VTAQRTPRNALIQLWVEWDMSQPTNPWEQEGGGEHTHFMCVRHWALVHMQPAGKVVCCVMPCAVMSCCERCV